METRIQTLSFKHFVSYIYFLLFERIAKTCMSLSSLMPFIIKISRTENTLYWLKSFNLGGRSCLIQLPMFRHVIYRETPLNYADIVWQVYLVYEPSIICHMNSCGRCDITLTIYTRRSPSGGPWHNTTHVSSTRSLIQFYLQ